MNWNEFGVYDGDNKSITITVEIKLSKGPSKKNVINVIYCSVKKSLFDDVYLKYDRPSSLFFYLLYI